MVNDILGLCRNNPQIVIFLALAIGYSIGKIKIFGFNLGSTAGVLIAALFLGQMNIEIHPLLKTVAFALFIFTIGYKVGPQFFNGLKKDGLGYLWISLFVGFFGLIVAIILGKMLGFDKGSTAGLLGGALTQSAVIGTAEGTIKHLQITDALKATLESNVAIAYAITYIFGTAGLVVFYKIVPKLMKVNLKEEAKKIEQEMSGSSEGEDTPELFSWYKRINIRAHKATNPKALNKRVSDVESMFPGRVAIEKLKRANQVICPDKNTIIQSGDIIAIVGNRYDIINAEKLIGPEVYEKDVVDLVGEILDICILKKEAVGKTLGYISEQYGHGCFLRKITRQGHEIPLAKNTVVHKCDVLSIAGAKSEVERMVQNVGYPERPTYTTDLIMVGLGCVLGTLFGLIAVKIGGIPITLGVGGGVLVSGLIFGWLRAVHPTFGQIPGGAQWIFTDLGLNLFIACVGLIAGPKAVHALQTTGGALFFAGVFLTLSTHIAGIIFGRLVLKMNPVILFGALTGSGTVTAALNALKEEANSTVPAIGYTVCYAFGNVILTIWGAVIISVM